MCKGYDPTPCRRARFLTAVRTYLNEDARRFICDTVIVAAVGTVNYTVTATVTVRGGFVPADVLAKVQEKFAAFAAEREVVGKPIPLSAIYDALVVDEVEAIHLTSPTADVSVSNIQVPILQGAAGITLQS